MGEGGGREGECPAQLDLRGGRLFLERFGDLKNIIRLRIDRIKFV